MASPKIELDLSCRSDYSFEERHVAETAKIDLAVVIVVAVEMEVLDDEGCGRS